VLLLLSLCAGNQGHLGDATVEHAAQHLPVIVDELLHKLIPTPDAPLPTPDAIRDMLSSRITAFDDAIAGDVLELFPGGIESLPGLTDEEIQAVVNDFAVPGDAGSNGAGSAGANYKKARLCLYGTTALVALVDPAHENLWVANLGDCEAGTYLTREQKKSKQSWLTIVFFFHTSAGNAGPGRAPPTARGAQRVAQRQ
jgi:pyruvate dehydrogenase phosphatase